VSPAAAQSARPNVVFILADNVGYGDLGVYGGGRRGARRRRGSINSRTRG
jgi:arylsulfatase A-like enzyme